MDNQEPETIKLDVTLEEYFRTHHGKAVDFMLRIDYHKGYPEFYIHPHNVNGETLNFKVEGNTVECTTHRYAE